MKKCSLVLALLLFGVMTLLAQRNITGNISSDQGGPLPGANILAKGTNVGTATDTDGNFELMLPSGATTLVISYTGHISQEVEVGDQTVINVILKAGTVLEDVVVVGYGTASKKELTGSVTRVAAETIGKLPVTSLDQAMQGQAAGVQVTSASGTPGASVSVRVRGPSSITASNQPLYVVDGIPINTGNYAHPAGPIPR